jgi:hypothetical protein
MRSLRLSSHSGVPPDYFRKRFLDSDQSHVYFPLYTRDIRRCKLSQEELE